MPKTRRSRIYTRSRGGLLRHYADFRDLNGRREPLVAEGEILATADPKLAELLCARRFAELTHRKAHAGMLGVERVVTLDEYAGEHVCQRSAAEEISPEWTGETKRKLLTAIQFFGADRDLASIRPKDVKAYAAHLRTLSNGRGGKLSPGSQKHYLNVLGRLFRDAIEAELYVGSNPVHSLTAKPRVIRKEARWLSV
jgi:hypothetical protein